MAINLKPRPQRRTGRWQFLAHKNEIGQLLESGMSVVMIWERLRDENRLSLSYAQLARYVRQHFKQPDPAEGPADKLVRREPLSAPEKPRGFSFSPNDPSLGPNDDNLI